MSVLRTTTLLAAILLVPLALAQTSDPFADEATDAAAADSATDPFVTYEAAHTNTTDAKGTTTADASAPTSAPAAPTTPTKSDATTPTSPGPVPAETSVKRAPGATLLVSALAVGIAAALVAQRRR